MTLIILAKGTVTTNTASPLTTTIAPPCVDIIPTWKCEKKKINGKCTKNGEPDGEPNKRLQKKCPKTCGKCTIACQDAPDGLKGTVNSNGVSHLVGVGVPDNHPTIGNYERCWHVDCLGKTNTLYIKSQVAYNVTFHCTSDEPIEDTCKDKWPQIHCKDCTEEKCKESKHSVLG